MIDFTSNNAKFLVWKYKQTLLGSSVIPYTVDIDKDDRSLSSSLSPTLSSSLSPILISFFPVEIYYPLIKPFTLFSRYLSYDGLLDPV